MSAELKTVLGLFEQLSRVISIKSVASSTTSHNAYVNTECVKAICLHTHMVAICISVLELHNNNIFLGVQARTSAINNLYIWSF